ncbi:hypothetical protein [Clostridium sp. KNHs214]|uniref:hypothetical protein n=1 Tax=Clostridium sp. KNHs214 TaxID=1540257 RepID=UPI00055195AC|nr:hypothetical protein [Clostridium sp. KNHs214]
MGATLKKKGFEPSITLIDVEFLMKGFRQGILIHTTIEEACDFVDWLNENPAFKTYQKEVKNKFDNKFFTFNDYKKKKSITINKDEVKWMEVPFYLDKSEEEVEFKFLRFR